MMLSLELKYIFFAIPRTASRAVQRWLFYNYGAVDTFNLWGKQFGHHATIVKRGFPLKDFYRFTIVRHPLDRLISLYHRWVGKDIEKKTWKITFDDFVRQYADKSLTKKHPKKRYRGRPWPGLMGQREFIEALPLPPDSILRYESLAEGLASLPFVAEPIVLPVFDASKRKAFGWYYRKHDTLQLAREVCKDDVEWLGYQWS